MQIIYVQICLFFLTVVFTPLQTPCLWAQDSRQVDKIIVRGNKVTNSWVIERELMFSSGEVVSKELLDFSIKRVEGTQLFNRVEAVWVESEQSGFHDLIITVTESLYLLPYPVLFFDGGHFDRISYGLGFMNRNYRGNGELLSMSGWLGYSPGFRLQYIHPWLGSKSGRHSLHLEALRISSNSNSKLFLRYPDRKFKLSALVKNYINPFFSVGAGYAIHHINMDSDEPVNPHGENKFWYQQLLTEFTFDSRDFIPYAHRGVFIKYQANKNGLGESELNNWEFNLDHRVFLPLGERHALAAQSLSLLTVGEKRLFQQKYFGYDYRLRGYFYSHQEGKNLQLNTLEYRFPLSEVYYISLPPPPGMESEIGSAGNNLKYGFSGILFYNNGIIWNTNSEFNLSNTLHGLGFGLIILAPIIEAIRLEFSWNEKGTYEGVFYINMAF